MESQLCKQSSALSFILRHNLPQTRTQKNRDQCSIISFANSKVSQASNGLATYKPSSWNRNFIESLETEFPIMFKEKMEELEKKVIIALNYKSGSLSSLQFLELVDSIEKLGLGYRFQDELRRALEKIASTNGNNFGLEEDSLHAASLSFRLLRQHGYNVSQDFLERFKDSHGGFMGCVQTDVKALLSLYEASYLAFEGESDLHEAQLFAAEHLLKLKGQETEVLDDHIDHALELPMYRRMLRLQARWYIDAYRKQKDANLHLLELAMLDFNMVQSALKRDLQKVSKWWGHIGLASKLCFIRDRLMECFFWTVGMVFEPQYYCCRVGLTKVAALITTLDDLYDVYGSLEELQIFTDAVKRWDINMAKHMPENFRRSFLALYDTINDMGYTTSSAQGENITPILGKVWGELCEAFFVEAKWTHNKYLPTLEDYLENAWQSVSGVVILTHGYFLTNQTIKIDARVSLEECRDLMKWSSMIFRLCNDLATSSAEIENGKLANAISCYMNENGVSEEVAREYIKTLIDKAWRKMIKARGDRCQESADPFIDMAINLARISHCTYQYGDGYGAPDDRAKDRILSVIIEPIAIREKSASISSIQTTIAVGDKIS